MASESPPAPWSSTPHPKYLDQEFTRLLPGLEAQTRRRLIEAARSDIEANQKQEDHHHG